MVKPIFMGYPIFSFLKFIFTNLNPNPFILSLEVEVFFSD